MASKCVNFPEKYLNCENVTPEDLQQYVPASSVTPDLIKLVLKSLARIHAETISYEDHASKPEKNYRLTQDHDLQMFSIDLNTPKVRNLIASVKANPFDQLEKRQADTLYRRVLSHGNLTSQNILFKNAEECKLINFKTKLYVPPICDVLQLIFFNTSEDFRQHHLDDLLVYYHNSLSEELDKSNIAIDTILGFDDLRKASHQFLPIVKLQKYILDKNQSLEELEEILSFPILSKEDYHSIIRAKIGTTKYKLLSAKFSHLNTISGFLGNYHKLQLKVQHETEETINLFIKTIPKNLTSKTIVEGTNCFNKEIFVYQTLVSETKKVGLEMFADCLPACYFSRPDDILVFDDTALQGYKTLSPQVPYDLTLLTLTLKKIAKFHAAMLVFEEKMSIKKHRQYRLNEEYPDKCHEICFRVEENYVGGQVMRTGVRVVPHLINLCPDLKTEKNIKNFEKMWPVVLERFFTATHPSNVYRNVLAHGDLWTSNIMIKHNGDKPIDCLFVDYQCLRYCPPGHDFLTVMYLTTDRETRIKHEEECRKIYYEELRSVLESLDYKVEDFFTFEEFLDSLDFIRPQMVMQTINYKMFTSCSPEDISSLLVDEEESNRVYLHDRKEYMEKMFERSPAFKKYLRECVVDLYDICEVLAATS